MIPSYDVGILCEEYPYNFLHWFHVASLWGIVWTITKKEEYSAFIATIIKDDENYQKLKYMLIELELWNDELQNLDNEVEKIKMQTRPDEN